MPRNALLQSIGELRVVSPSGHRSSSSGSPPGTEGTVRPMNDFLTDITLANGAATRVRDDEAGAA